MSHHWIEPRKISVPEYFSQTIGGNPLTIQVLYDRGITNPSIASGFLTPQYYHPTPSLELPGLEKLTGLLYEAIHSKRKIGVWGDFDVDGQTATTILVSALQDLGGDVAYHIPVRASESHGISIQALQQFLLNDLDLILTCD